MSLRERILNYYKNHKGEWISSGEIQRLVVEKTKYTPQNAGRRLRELAEDGLLEVEYRKGHAFYRFNEAMQPMKRVSEIEVKDGVAYETYKLLPV